MNSLGRCAPSPSGVCLLPPLAPLNVQSDISGLLMGVRRTQHVRPPVVVTPGTANGSEELRIVERQPQSLDSMTKH